MKRLRLAFLYNLRQECDPSKPLFHQSADWDDPETIAYFIKHLKQCGYRVLALEANEQAYLQLYQKQKAIDLVFNYAMGLHGLDRYAQLPAMLEMLQLPYTGSSPLTQALILNKEKMLQVLQAKGLAVLAYQLMTKPNQPLRSGLNYPLIVKPVAQGSSAGITQKSVVCNRRELNRQLRFVLQAFKEPALVQPFLQGREFSVSLLGNPPRILPLVEPDFSLLPSGYLPLDSLEVKWIFEEETAFNYLTCPARVAPLLEKKIKAICLTVWQVLGMRDFCRIDMRQDRQGRLYVLDVNSPGLIPPEVSQTSYLPLAARKAGIDFNQLLKTIINSALKRYRWKC